MNILILGAAYSSNLGDGVICESTAYLLRKIYPDAVITIKDLINRTRIDHSIPPTGLRGIKKAALKNQVKIAAVRWLHYDRIYRNYSQHLRSISDYTREVCSQDVDLVVVAGGQLFMDRYALYLAHYVQEFSRKQIPVCINACGTGPLYSPSIRRLLKKALLDENVRSVSCRDNTKQMNALCGTEDYVKPAADPALWADTCYGITAASSDTVGLGIMFAPNLSQKKLLRFWTKLIEELDARKIRWKFFVNGAGTDILFAKEVFSQLPAEEGEFASHFAPVPDQPEDLVRMLSGFRSIISFRLHSHIIAAALGIPSVALTWDEKLPQFFRSIHHPERCLTIDTDVSCILSSLSRAEEEGVDSALIRRQREAAFQQLSGALNGSTVVTVHGNLPYD